MNNFRIGTDGRTAYERITEHKCKHAMIGFGESVDFILENDKGAVHKADSRVQHGIFLGYVWRSTEYLVGTRNGIYKCRTVRRRAEDISYDPECVEYLQTSYYDYVMKGAKSTVGVSFPGPGKTGETSDIPIRAREAVPRRVYVRSSDYDKHGFTMGCKGCTWFQNRLGTRPPHSDACRERLEKLIADDPEDNRAQKAKERLDFYLEQQVKQGDTRDDSPPEIQEKELADDPRQEDAPLEEPDAGMDGPEKFEIGTPGKPVRDGDEDMAEELELDDGPASFSERRLHTPVRKAPIKIKTGNHDDQPGGKKIITGDVGDDMTDLNLPNDQLED